MFLFAFPAGISAACSPCVIILIPLLMCRFVEKETRSAAQMLLLVAGFLSTFVVISFFLQQLFNSSFSNGIRLGLGLLFVTMGFQSFIGKMSPMSLPFFHNTFMLGIVFAILVVFNPCTIPYVGIFVSLFRGPELILQMMLFALGLLTPALGFTLFGQALLSAIQQRTSRFFHWLNKILAVVLVGSGVYMAFTIHSLTVVDSVAATVCLCICFFLLIRTYAQRPSLKSILTQRRAPLIFLFSALCAAGALGACCWASTCRPSPPSLLGEGESAFPDEPDSLSLSCSSAPSSLPASSLSPTDEFVVSFRPDFDALHDRRQRVQRMMGERGMKEAKEAGKGENVFVFDNSFIPSLDPSSPFSPSSASLFLLTNSYYPSPSSPLLFLSPLHTLLDPATMTSPQSLSSAFPPLPSLPLSSSSSARLALSRVTCAAVPPCPGCPRCAAAALIALVCGAAAILSLSPRRPTLDGITKDTCTIPKFKRDRRRRRKEERERARQRNEGQNEGLQEGMELEREREEMDETETATEYSDYTETEGGGEGQETEKERKDTTTSAEAALQSSEGAIQGSLQPQPILL